VALEEALSQEIIQEMKTKFNIKSYYKVQVIKGEDFVPTQCAFSGPIPNNTNFFVYHFDVVRKGLREFRLF